MKINKMNSLVIAASMAFAVGSAAIDESIAPAFAQQASSNATAAAQPAMSASEAIKKTVNEVIRILNDQNLRRPEKANERIRLLEKTVGERFDYTEMSRRTLGGEWAKLNDAQKAEFVDTFQRFLSASYASKLDEYSGQQVTILGERREGEYAEVRTKINHNKAEIPMDYRLMNKNGEWRTYDVVVDGISLVGNYRSQFAKIIKQSGYNELLNQLKKKVENHKSADSQITTPTLNLRG